MIDHESLFRPRVWMILLRWVALVPGLMLSGIALYLPFRYVRDAVAVFGFGLFWVAFTGWEAWWRKPPATISAEGISYRQLGVARDWLWKNLSLDGDGLDELRLQTPRGKVVIQPSLYAESERARTFVMNHVAAGSDRVMNTEQMAKVKHEFIRSGVSAMIGVVVGGLLARACGG